MIIVLETNTKKLSTRVMLLYHSTETMIYKYDFETTSQ
jgi:hypothetical protein